MQPFFSFFGFVEIGIFQFFAFVPLYIIIKK